MKGAAIRPLVAPHGALKAAELLQAAILLDVDGTLRESLDKFKAAYEAGREVLRRGDAEELMGYTLLRIISILDRHKTPATEADAAFLRGVCLGATGKPGAPPRWHALAALYGLAKVAWEKADREEQASCYRQLAVLAEQLTEAELRAPMRARDLSDITVGKFFMGKGGMCETAKLVFARLLRGENAGGSDGPHSAYRLHRTGPNCGSHKAVVALVGALANQLVGGKCAFCGRPPREDKTRLALCSGCQGAAYCDPACQLADWKEGVRGIGPHKVFCRKPIALRVSDVVRVHSVEAEELKQLNGTIMEVGGDPDPAVAPSPDKVWLVRGMGVHETYPVKAACLTRLMFAEQRPADTLTTGS
jgi:hypothetical protein